MHELSVAMGIVELAEEESQGRGGATISASRGGEYLMAGVP